MLWLVSNVIPLRDRARRVAKLAPEIPRALLATDEADEKRYLRKMWLGFWARPHMVNLDHEMIGPERMESFTDRGLRVGVWTVINRFLSQLNLILQELCRRS